MESKPIELAIVTSFTVAELASAPGITLDITYIRRPSPGAPPPPTQATPRLLLTEAAARQLLLQLGRALHLQGLEGVPGAPPAH